MNLKSLRWLGAVPVLALVVALAATGSAAAGTATKAATTVPGCIPATNIEAVIDDSGSMSSSDPSKFRTKLLDAFAGYQINDGKTFGGVEFGDPGAPNTEGLFGPATIPAVIPQMQTSFFLVNADSGGTDYEAGFSLANQHNPSANARIFLSDGFPNAPATQHLNPLIKTYVVGLGSDFVSSPDAQATLAKIASDTGGPAPFLIADSSQLQPVAGALSAAINCKNPPITFTKAFSKQGQAFNVAFKATAKTADVLITWPTDGTLIVPTVGGKGKKARSSAVKVKIKKGATFSSAKLRGLKPKKKVKFKVQAKTLPLPTTATIQIIP